MKMRLKYCPRTVSYDLVTYYYRNKTLEKELVNNAMKIM